MPNWAKMGFAMNPWGTSSRATTSSRRRRKKATAKATPTRRKKRTSSKRPARLVKGSAAAKAYMAKIRKRRGK